MLKGPTGSVADLATWRHDGNVPNEPDQFFQCCQGLPISQAHKRVPAPPHKMHTASVTWRLMLAEISIPPLKE